MSCRERNPYKVVPVYSRCRKNYIIQRKDDMSFVHLPSKYLKHLSIVRESPNTVKRIAFSITYYLTYMAEKEIRLKEVYALTYGQQTEHFKDFLLWLKYGKYMDGKKEVVKNSTCNAYLGDVFGWLQYLHLEYAEEFPTIKVLVPKGTYYCKALGAMIAGGTRTTFEGYLPNEESYGTSLTKAEIVKLLNACIDIRDKLQISLMAETGLRIGELLGIHYDKDIDFEQKIIHVRFRENNQNEARAKNKESRDVLMSENTFELLVEYMSKYAELLKEHNLLFISLKGKKLGQAENMSAVSAMFKRLEKRTGIHASPHMLRHYFAVSRWEAGWDLFMIANALGHRSIRTTERYLHLQENTRIEASRKYFEEYGSILQEKDW